MTINAGYAIEQLRASAASKLQALTWKASDITASSVTVTSEEGYLNVKLTLTTSSAVNITEIKAYATAQDTTTQTWLTINGLNWQLAANTTYYAIIKLSFRNDLGGLV